MTTLHVVTISVEELEQRIEAAVRRAVGEREPADWIDQSEAAKLLGVARSSVPTMCQRDGLPHARVGRVYRFRRALIEAWLEERATRAGGHGPKHARTLRALRGGK